MDPVMRDLSNHLRAEDRHDAYIEKLDEMAFELSEKIRADLIELSEQMKQANCEIFKDFVSRIEENLNS